MKIVVNVKQEQELYNAFDGQNMTLSDDVISFIINKISLASIKDNIDIEILSQEKIDENKFKRAFNNYIDEQFKLLEIEGKLNTTKRIWMSFIGIIFIGLSISLSIKFNDLILQIISTIGSFALWEAAGSWLLERKTLNLKKIRLRKLYKLQIIFKYNTENSLIN